MAITAMTDIVQDLNPHIHEFYVNGSTIAGAAVYLSELNGVSMTSNGSQSFKGVALDNVADNNYVSVAVPPTVVYMTLSATANVSAGTFLMPSTTVGDVVVADAGPVTIVGQVEDFYSTSVVRVQLMCVPNSSV